MAAGKGFQTIQPCLPFTTIPPVSPSVLMRRERPDNHRRAGRFACGLQHLFNTREFSPGEHGHRWSGARQARTEHIGIVDAQHGVEMRHQRRSSGLVPSIPKRVAKAIVFACLQRMNEREDTLQIEDGVVARNRRGKRGACFRRRQAGERRRNDDTQVVRPLPAQRQRLPFIVDHGGHPTEECSGGVVAVPFQFCRDRQQGRIRQHLRNLFEDPEAGNRRCGTASETGRHRDLAIDVNDNGTSRCTEVPKRRREGACDGILARDGRIAR
jgi:hypothetical protein